ncbi:outer membrane channel protein, partial [Vibrio vulnificus]
MSVQAKRDAAFEAVTSSRSTLLPQINLTAGYNLKRGDTDLDAGATIDNDQNALTAGINFSQELYQRSSWITLDNAEKSARQADAAYAAT